MRATLLLFENVLGLKVNFNKSMLVGVNVVDSWLSKAAMVMNCKTDRLSFVYHGHPIGNEVCRLNFWLPLLNCIKARLSCWKSKSPFFRWAGDSSSLSCLICLGKEKGGLGVRKMRV